MATIATKFVTWDIQPLESLQEEKVYKLRMKVINGEKLNRDEKNWVTENVNHNTTFRNSIPLLGWRFDFSGILKTFVVKQYSQWTEYRATDKTALRHILYGKIDKIVEVI
jgi:hypothetical protein